MKPLPPSSTVAVYAIATAASGTTCAHASSSHPRRFEVVTMNPTTNATPIPTPRAMPTSFKRSTMMSPSKVGVSSSSANATAANNNGTQTPSFKPLSTLSPWRTRDGSRLSDTTVWPSAASVGARSTASTIASKNSSSGKSQSAIPEPKMIVSGRPIPSSRAGNAASRESRRTLSDEASPNRTSARVTSARRRMSPTLSPDPIVSKTSLPRRNPTPVNKIAGVIAEPRTRPDTAAKAIRTIETSVIPQPICQRPLSGELFRRRVSASTTCEP